MSLEDWLAERAAERRAAGLERRLPDLPPGDFVNLAGNDYLGFAQDPRVVKAASTAAEAWGAGAGASRLVTGTLPVPVFVWLFSTVTIMWQLLRLDPVAVIDRRD